MYLSDDSACFFGFFCFLFCFVSVLFITITGYVGVIPPQGPPASPHQGCQGPPGLDMQNVIQYTIYILVCIIMSFCKSKSKNQLYYWCQNM